MNNKLLHELEAIIAQRKKERPEDSYTTQLFEQGEDMILRKLGEETIELILAAKSGVGDDLVHECADLWFHSLVLLQYHDLELDDILRELGNRFGRSGLEEKKMRHQ